MLSLLDARGTHPIHITAGQTHGSSSNELLHAATAPDLRRIHVSPRVDRHVVQEHELPSLATDPPELADLFERLPIK